MIEEYFTELEDVLKQEMEAKETIQPSIEEKVTTELTSNKTNIWLHAISDTFEKRKQMKRN